MVVEPDTGWPWSSTSTTRSASPSKARPTSASPPMHRGLEVLEVLDVDRVGGVVRERAVELAEEELELEGQPRHHRGHDQAAHAVGGVGDDAQRRQRGDVDERAHVGDERGEQVATLDPARVLAALEQAAGDHAP